MFLYTQLFITSPRSKPPFHTHLTLSVPFFLRSLGTTCAVHILPVCIGIHWSMGNNQGSQFWRKLIFLFPDTINYQDLLSYGKTPCLKFHICWHFVWLNFVLISPVTIVTNTVSSYVAYSFSCSCKWYCGEHSYLPL